MSTATLTPKPATDLMTIEAFLAQYGDTPADLVKGKIVEFAMPGFRHGRVCNCVADHLNQYQRNNDIGHVVTNDTHVRIQRNPDTARGMDVGFISYTRLPKETIPEGVLEATPELVFEVRSPSDRWSEILTKVIDYLDIGVDVVIVLDPKTTSAIVYRQQDRQETFDADDTLTLPDILPGFSVTVAKFFE